MVWKLLLDFIRILKSYVGIGYEPAQNMFKVNNKTPERHQMSSFRCPYCKLYTHFMTFLVFVFCIL